MQEGGGGWRVEVTGGFSHVYFTCSCTLTCEQLSPRKTCLNRWHTNTHTSMHILTPHRELDIYSDSHLEHRIKVACTPANKVLPYSQSYMHRLHVHRVSCNTMFFYYHAIMASAHDSFLTRISCRWCLTCRPYRYTCKRTCQLHVTGFHLEGKWTKGQTQRLQPAEQRRQENYSHFIVLDILNKCW